MREELTEAVVRRCSQKFHKTHRKTPAPESPYQQSYMPKACNSVKIETPAQALSRKPREIPKNTPLTEHHWWLLPN